MKVEKKTVIYFSGGGMRGVFGAGVATALEEADVYKNIKAVYAASAGALTGAYFLSEQTKMGSSIFYEDLTHDFISIKGFWIGAWQRIQNKFIYKVPKEKLQDAMDIDYLFDVVKNKKSLDTEKIINQEIPFYIKVFNLDDKKIEYLDAKNKDIFSILVASTSALPYVHQTIEVGGNTYTDGSVIEQIGIEYLIKKHPNDKIVVVFCPSIKRSFKVLVKNFLEGLVTSFMYDWSFFSKFSQSSIQTKKDLEMIENHPNIHIVKVSEEKAIPTRTAGHDEIFEIYKLGINSAKKVLDFIKN